jgi:aminoglycoside phosphotransferase (APT) family kinase protein
MAAVQRHFAGRDDELVAAGVPDRRLPTLPGRLAEALAEPEVRRWLDVDDRRAGALVAWVTAAVAEVAALGLPDVLVHGDFHPGNVVRTAGGPVVFDWSDAAVGHPFVDVATWTSWLRDDAAATDRVWQGLAEAWADVCPVAAVTAQRPTLAGVVAAHHVVSYAAVVAGTERCLQFQHADGLREYVADLELAVSATGGDR